MSNSAPDISVIVPCYNHGEFLSSTLASVQDQTFRNFQCVIVDDGSTDNSSEIAESWAARDDRFVPVRKTNGGLANARNCGVKVASGAYLLFLDSDDLIHPDMLQLVMREACRSKAELINCGWSRFRDDPASDSFGGRGPVSLAAPVDVWLQRNPLPVHSVVVKKELVEKVCGCDEHFTACEDWDLWLRIALGGVVTSSVPECLAYYRVLPGSMSSSRDRMLLNRVRVLENSHQIIALSENLVDSYGSTMGEICYRLRNRLLTMPKQIRAEAIKTVREIHEYYRKCGKAAPSSAVTRLAENYTPSLFELILPCYYRCFRSTYFKQLEEGFC